MNKCNFCEKETKNPKFCSRSCRTKLYNRLCPKRCPKYFCVECGEGPLKNKIKYCKKCHRNPQALDWSKITIAEVQVKRKSFRNSRIRQLSRIAYKKSSKPKKCIICGYEKYYEVCHIKAIHSFSEDTIITVVNDINNLIALCPNCHWEYDNELLDILPYLERLVGLEPTTP